MSHYSVAAAKDGLSSLIDKALRGEEVIITRRGQAVVALRTLPTEPGDREVAFDRLRAFRETIPASTSPIPLERFSEWLNEDEEA